MKGLHHIHLRKRRADDYEPFPARSAWKRALDRVVLCVGVIGPIATAPQIYKIYAFQNAAGVSALSWGIWALLDIPWIIYGFVHRERPIILTYTLWLIINTIVCVGAILYGSAG